tara:strand:+ start:336 stop:575 length:240 start_codon:yes stop_codon:yes gene_type:complete
MNYFKYLTFFFVSVIDSVINMVCSIIAYYPAMDLASYFLTRVELGRVFKVILGRDTEREGKAQDALKDIKDISNGKNNT